MNRNKYCLDAHPLIWYFTGQKSLSHKAKKILDEIFSRKIECFIPSIVLLEVFHLSLKRGKFKFLKFLEEIRLLNITIIPLDKVVLTTCFRLPKNLNIHDRIISASAIVTNSLLLTKDKELKNIKLLKSIW
jgi:predicted nucleic acid-binding protein